MDGLDWTVEGDWTRHKVQRWRPYGIAAGIFLGGATLAWFPVAALLTAGFPNRWARVGAYTLVCLGAYAGLLLTIGTQPFML